MALKVRRNEYPSSALTSRRDHSTTYPSRQKINGAPHLIQAHSVRALRSDPPVRSLIDATDFERHGWRDKAYMDVFTACRAHRSSGATHITMARFASNARDASFVLPAEHYVV
jgi:hypothetical protein